MRRGLLGVGALGLCVALLAGAYLLSPNPETDTLDDAARRALPGTYLKLADGVTHYEAAGPVNGAPVVFVHGFSTPAFIWDKNFPRVAEAGYRAVRYDLYSRGLSDRLPGVRHDDELFDRQLLELIQTLQLPAPVRLVGLSMGGAIVVNFAKRHPELVHSVVLVDPAGFPLPMPLSARLMQWPGVGEYLMRVAGPGAMRQGMASNFHDPSLLNEFAEKFAPQMRYKGYLAGQLSTLRYMPLQTLQPAYEALGRSGKPVLLVWGKQDAVIPYATVEKVQTAVPQTQLLTVDPAGHVPNYERPEVVNPRLLEFLGGR
jgi:pimeloyl-ACP methyl ester carboxylesterase